MSENNNKIEYLALVIYSFITKFLVSINSIRFNEVFTDTDQAIFFSIGKAMLHGKILYKDVFDHKTPYIYFFNAFAALFEKNHIGLYIIEVVLLSTILIFLYKTSLIFTSKFKSFMASIVMATILSIPQITFSYSRTEMYAIAFIMPVVYLFAKYFADVTANVSSENRENEFSPIKMFVIGIFAALTLMTNIRAVVIFVPFAVALLIKLVKMKKIKNLCQVFVAGLVGVVVTILPYVIYAVFTESLNDAIYAIFTSNMNYAESNFTFGKNIFKTALNFLSANKVFFAFIFLSFILWFNLKIDKYIKYSIISSMVITILYVILSNRTNPYYLVILLPYLISIYFVIARFINFKINFSMNVIYIIMMILFLMMNIFINRDMIIRYMNAEHRADRINTAIKNYIDKENPKVLSFGFNPEVYIYTNSTVEYKYFFIPNIPYSADKTPYTAQYRYIMERDPDVIVYANSNAGNDMPTTMFDQIRITLSTSYNLVDEFKTNDFTGTFYIFIKKP